MKYLISYNEAKRGELLKDKIDFLWEFFIDLKDDGLEVWIGLTTKQIGQMEYKYIEIQIQDRDNIYGGKDSYYTQNLFDKEPIQEILNRLKSTGNIPRRISSGGDSLTISFDRYGEKKYGVIVR